MRSRRRGPAANTRSPSVLVVIGIIASGLVIAGCADDGYGGSGATPIVGDFDYASLDGDISSDGSSTVYPITAAMAEDFNGVARGVSVSIGFAGTGGGFALLCGGDVEIANASRAIEDDEAAQCSDNGIDDIAEFQVGIDALTVVVNPENDFVTCLTLEQLAAIFSGQATNWNEVDPSFPDRDLAEHLYYPGADSGTFDYFVNAVILEAGGEDATHTGTGTSSEDDNILATGIEGDPDAIGYFGFAYFQGAGSNLRAVEIDAGDGCVPPTRETALDGTYPLSRPLFVYTTEALLEEPYLAGFMNFYLDNIERIVPEVGYVPLPDDVLAEQRVKLEPFLP